MPSSSPAKAKTAAHAPQNEQESAELARFRQEWLAELKKRKAEHNNAGSTTTGTTVPAAPSSSKVPLTFEVQIPQLDNPASPKSPHRATEPSTPKAPALPVNHPALTNGEITYRSPVLQNALGFYRRAIEHEQRGELDDALNLYRQAFRLDDNVDRAYRREQMLQAILNEQEAINKKALAPQPKRDEVEDLSASFESAVTIKPERKAGPTTASITGTLATLVHDFPHDLKFEPEIENEPVFLHMLPEELLVVVISKLDATSVERFGSVSKKARMLTLDSGIWRELVRVTYNPPQVPDQETMASVVERLLFDYRRVYIEHPRIRLDGVYIAICHYVRPGLSENSWVNLSHFITYHRYLRFFPNGQVLSLLANEENSPQQVIPLLKATLRMKGLSIGHWKLIGTTVHLSSLVDASGRFALPMPGATDGAHTGSTLPAPELPAAAGHGHGHGHHGAHHGGSSSSSSTTQDRARYVFDMTLNLRSKPLGRWNRMDIQTYDSVHIDSGDVQPVVLKHERPFWFSKVRSYA